MRIPSRGRTPGSSWFPGFGVFTLVVGFAAVAAAQGAGRGAQKAAPPAQASAAPAQVSAVAIRIVGPGFGANGTELRPFNEQPGTVVVLAIQAPRGSGIVDVDNHASKLEGFADDKGVSLLEEGRVGSFPKVAEDGSAALVEIEVRARPSGGAASVTAQGTLAMTLSSGAKPVRAAGVRLAPDQTFKLGSNTLTIGEVKAEEEEGTRVAFGLTRTLLNSIREVRFFDAKNAAIEARRVGSGYMNERAHLEYVLKTKDKTATVEFELWQNPRLVKVPFSVQAGLGVAAGARSSATTDGAQSPAAAEKKDKPPAPPPVITAADGAASIDAVVKQLQTAAPAGKGAEVLSVIHPHDRGTFGQALAMMLALLPMQSMEKPAEGEKIQKQLDALFAKHKVKPPFLREPDDLFKGVDLPAFVSDALVFLKGQAKKGEKPSDMLPIPSGRPENVRVNGDSAVATLSGKEINFTQVGGKWFIRLE